MTESAVNKKPLVGLHSRLGRSNNNHFTMMKCEKELSHTFWARSLHMWNQTFQENQIDHSNNQT